MTIQDPVVRQPRELTSRDKCVKNAKPREVYKEKKIKRVKDISRNPCEEKVEGEKPSASVGGQTAGSGVSPEGKIESQQAERGVDTAARENTTSRAFPGISAYHCKTRTGVKININLQNREDAAQGIFLEVTAELKRRDRFRELREYEGDNDTFKIFARQCVDHYRSLPGDWCIGRAHQRGQRDMWYTDFLVIGRMEQDIVTQVQIWIDDDCYDIPLDITLNANQIRYYHTGGILGSLRSSKTAPSIHTAKRRAF